MSCRHRACRRYQPFILPMFRFPIQVQDDPGLSLRDFTSVALRIFNDIIFVVLMVVMAIVSVMVVCIMAPYVDVA